jgi:actin-like ATPase involved in cell morphogenesis
MDSAYRAKASEVYPVDQAMLKDLDRRIREETGLPVSIADNPLCCVVLGTGKILDDFKLLRRLSIESMAA